MRPMMRFLFVAILLCIELQVSEVQPVYAKDWKPGNYVGFFELVAKSHTETHTSGNGGSSNFTVTVKWSVEGRLKLKIIDAEHAVLTIENVPPVEVTHGSSNEFTAGEMKCNWRSKMDGTSSLIEARPLSPSGRDNNFAGGKFILGAFWDSPIKWNSITGSSSGSACTEWGLELAKVQQEASNQMIKLLNEISFDAVFYGPNMIGGSISLPKWEGVITIKNGTVTRTVPKDSWRVYREGSKEWKKWMKEGKQK